MKKLSFTLIFSSILTTMVACGGTDREIEAHFETPEARDSKVALRPALDISNLYDPSIADRIVIESIELNVADVRLLGADPRMPAGGLALLDREIVLEAYEGTSPSLELPFPAYLSEQDDLAVYIRIDRSEALMNASVVVRGRIYSQPTNGGASSLTASSGEDHTQDEGEGVDPDGDPADDPLGDCGRMGGVDPDGDPAIGCDRRYLVSRGESARSVPFELRGDDVADLITGIDATSALDVVIGIPASRWFTPEAMKAINAQLFDRAERPTDKAGERHNGRRTVVIDSRLSERAETTKDDELANEEEYFAAEDDMRFDDLKTRRPARD